MNSLQMQCDGADMVLPPPFAELAAELSPEDYRHVLGLLRADVSRLMNDIAQAARADDATAFRRAAHGLAGAAGTVGAEDLAKASREAMAPADTSAWLVGATARLRALAADLLDDIAQAEVGTGPDGAHAPR